HSPKEVSAHRVVEAMVSKDGMIDIVTKTANEVVPGGNRGNFDEGMTGASDQITEQRDVEFERWNRRVFCRLATCEQKANFVEKFVAYGDAETLFGFNRRSRGR